MGYRLSRVDLNRAHTNRSFLLGQITVDVHKSQGIDSLSSETEMKPVATWMPKLAP